ncbi:MAG: phytochelatin synthase family protein, partial [Cyanobium sp.]
MSFCSPGRTRPGRVFGPSLLAPLLLGVCTAAASLNAPQPAAAAPPTASIPAAAASALPTAPVTRLAAGLAPLPLLSEQGQQLLFRSRLRADYVPLSQEFLTQATLSYCGVASAVMVLNSLALPAPETPGYGPYRFWTQDNLFSAPAARTAVAPETVAKQGMTLAELAGLL